MVPQPKGKDKFHLPEHLLFTNEGDRRTKIQSHIEKKIQMKSKVFSLDKVTNLFYWTFLDQVSAVAFTLFRLNTSLGKYQLLPLTRILIKKR